MGYVIAALIVGAIVFFVSRQRKPKASTPTPKAPKPGEVE